MEYIDKIIDQNNHCIDKYIKAVVRLQRKRDFFIYFFIPKLTSKKFDKVNAIIVELKNWKVEFEKEFTKITKNKQTSALVKEWLTSYKEYVNKVHEHISILEELQPLYVRKFSEKLNNSQKIKDKLERISVVADECQELGNKYNEKVKLINPAS